MRSRACFRSRLQRVAIFRARVVVSDQFSNGDPYRRGHVTDLHARNGIYNISCFPIVTVRLRSNSRVGTTFIRVVSSARARYMLVFQFTPVNSNHRRRYRVVRRRDATLHLRPRLNFLELTMQGSGSHRQKVRGPLSFLGLYLYHR